MRKVSYKGDMKNTAQVVGRNIPISRKIGREIAVFICGKYVDRAIVELQSAAEGKLAIPYKRYNCDTPHRRGKIMSGRFPKSASSYIVNLLKSLKANAENKALSEDDILIVHAACQHAGIAWHYGRQRRRRRKLAHFELVGVEKEKDEKVEKVEKTRSKQVSRAPSPKATEKEKKTIDVKLAKTDKIKEANKKEGKNKQK